ncbi:NAD dependent epimerase/dehydratase [Colletotrichum karsti]|uniref:NAD dependent epimerase/dehydratase n=1 Tax=Colletotrichum karsti TaxID=1095194 RepID=A0A9P6LJR9_9PEZI|nr:NAD dependent epimerase/dehydratase [Colletotrichum karsti]KAF9878654.1 NAD dependent epimerase/dehydratase [Colletotrichum karsti]
MSHNILITGAAGYIGGSVLANFLARSSGPIKTANLFAAVRSEEQMEKLANLNVHVVQLDLADERAVKQVVADNDIDFVIYTAGVIDQRPVSSLIESLGERRMSTGRDVYFIYTGVSTTFLPVGGWSAGVVRDTDQLFEKEKEIGGPNHARLTSIFVVEKAEALGVTAFNVPVPVVYGRGTGEGRKLSVNIPAFVRSSIKHKVVHKFDEDGNAPAVHVSDLAELYTILTEKTLLKEPIPSGAKGYYFGVAHQVSWWDVMQKLAEVLHARGLVTEPAAQVWPSDDVAAEALGFPKLYIRAMGTASGNLVSENSCQLGWQPKWTREKFLASIDDEVEDILELDTVKTSLFSELLTPSAN